MNYSRSKATMRREWGVVSTYDVNRTVLFLRSEGAKARRVFY